jgi:hypothetical protein
MDNLKPHLFSLTLCLLVLTACGSSTPAPRPTATSIATAGEPTSPPPTNTPAATEIPQPTATPTQPNAVAVTPASPTRTSSTSVAAKPVDIGADRYLDNRSDGVTVIESLFNAINRKEYVRAYSYWQNTDQVPSFDKFEEGYADTKSVQLQLGTVNYSVGAGQTYYTVPVVLTARTTQGETQTFAGCYTLHLGSPNAQATPPFQPVGIVGAVVKQVANDSNPQELLAQACQEVNQEHGAVPSLPRPTPDPTDISNDRYLDDRSDAVELLRSLFNALNSRQYLRAYSYWQDTSQIGSFDQFRKGYADTASIQLQTGTVIGDAGAGQFRYYVPVVLTVKTTQGQTQTFAGCYNLHLANPSVQATLPFQPLGIESANIKQVANDANTAALLAQACQETGGH